MQSWNPNNTNRLLDTCQEVLQAIKDGTLDSRNLYPKAITKLGGEPKKLIENAFYHNKTSPPQWVQEQFPNGWSDFLALLKELDGNGLVVRGSHERHNMPTQYEKGELETVQEWYRNGDISREDALSTLAEAGIQLTDFQTSTYFPKRNGNGNNHNPQSDLEAAAESSEPTFQDTLRDLRQRHNAHKTRIKKIKATNPRLLLGHAYQNLVLAALGLAHLDGIVYPEVALTHEKENGELTRTTNIVDAVVVNKDGKRTLYEIKLGRQRQGLRKQVLKQNRAAKQNPAYQNADHFVIAGSKHDDCFGAFVSQMAIEIGEDEEEVAKRLKKDPIKEDEEEYSLRSISSLFGGEEIKVTSLTEILRRAAENIRKRAQITGTKGTHKVDEREKGFLSTLRSIESNQVSLMTIFIKANDALQSRRMSVDEIEKYDKNLYLLQHYIRHKLRRDLRPSRLPKMSLRNSPLRDLTIALISLDDVLNRDYHSETEFFPSFEKRYAFFQKRLRDGLPSYKDIKDLLFGENVESFWTSLLGGEREVQKVLKRRDRSRVFYEEDGFFKPGKRVISRRSNENNWMLEDLESIGIDTSDIDLDDEEQIRHYAKVLEDHYNQAEELLESSLTKQRTELERKKIDLEILTDNQEFSKKTGTGLSQCIGLLKKIGINSWAISGLKKQKIKDRLLRAYASLTYSFSRKNNKTGQVIKNLREEKRTFDFSRTRMIPFISMPKTLRFLKRGVDILERITPKYSRIKDSKNLYKSFLRNDLSKESLDTIEKQARAYLRTAIEDGSDIETYLKELPDNNQKNNLNQAIVRSHLFEETGLIEKYFASKLLQHVMTAKELYGFDPATARVYMGLARQEMQDGQDHGSKNVAKYALERISTLISDNNELEQHYADQETLKTK